MLTNRDFTFTLSVSKRNYAQKPSDAEASKMEFKPRQFTIGEALDSAVNGKVLCPVFRSSHDDGYFSIKGKTDDNYIGASAFFFDFDRMPVPMDEFIGQIPFKPSFAYTSYRDGLDGSRFRLSYVFDNMVVGQDEFLKIYNAIGNANRFVPETKEHGGLDVRGCSQMYYGTTTNAHTYTSDIVYNVSDFDSYVVPADEYRFVSKTSSSVNPDSYRDIDSEFIQDLDNLPYGSFFKKYFDKYYAAYQKSLETSLVMSDNEMWLEYPDDYVAVFRRWQGKTVKKWQIGEDRKTKLYITGQIMMHNCPDMPLENLVYNLVIERRFYYENQDGKIDNQVLIQTAINAFNRRISLSPSKHGTFRVNKEYWNEQGIGVHQAKGYIKRQRNVQTILPHYDFSRSIKENHEALKEMGINVSVRTLQRMVASGDINAVNKAGEDTLLYQCRSNATILQDQITDLMRKNDRITNDEIAKQLDVDISTVKRNIKKMRGVLIEREGNNRSGRWVVLDSASDSKSEYDTLERMFESGKAEVVKPQPKTDEELTKEMIEDGYTVSEIKAFFAMYEDCSIS